MKADIHSYRRFILPVLIVLSLTTTISAAPASDRPAAPRAATVGTYDWLQFAFDPRHSGNNTREAALNPTNVNRLHRRFQVTLPSFADGAPAYLSSVNTASGLRDLVFVTTRAGHIIALDAHTGAQIWSQQYAAGSCRINNGTTICYTTSSPAIDPNRQFVYSYGLDGRVHKYAVGTGTETMTAGWPQVATLKGFDEKGSSAISIATAQDGTTYLYMAHGGYPGDAGDYQGHITAINLATGAQRVFNAACSNQTVHFVTTPGTPDCPSVQTAIWARPGVIYNPDTNKIYMVTGNGTFLPASHYWGDTVFSLNADGTGSNGDPLDTYTPTDYQNLDTADLDLGSTAPAILPVPANSSVQHLAVQGGKDAKLRLINLDNMSGQGGIGHTGGEVGPIINVPQGGQVLTMPAVWVNPADSSTWVFVTNGSGISGLQLQVDSITGAPSLTPRWNFASPGTSPIIANGILFYANSNLIRALRPTDGTQLWSDNQIGGIHWESPIVANGVLYITDNSNHLTAYSLTGENDRIGVFRPSDTTFYLRNTNTSGPADLTTTLGASTDLPVVGDWNGDGVDTVGVYRPGTGQFFLRDSNAQGAPIVYTLVLGSSGDVPIAGDWTASGHDSVGVFRPSNGLIFLRNTLTSGFADFTMVLGIPGDTPVAGDWNGDGVDSPGVFRPSNGTFYLTNQICNCGVTADYAVTFGVGTDLPMAGDWTISGRSGLGVFRPSNGLIFLKNVPITSGVADTTLVMGIANDKPIAGHWVAPGPIPPPANPLAPTFVPAR
jgi:PQQ-like domain